MSLNSYLSLFTAGLAANRPTAPDLAAAAPNTPVLYYATDTGVLSIFVAAAWVNLGVGAAKIYTVATLPANPVAGQYAVVSDATTPALGATVVGAGAVQVAVVYSGAAWKVA